MLKCYEHLCIRSNVQTRTAGPRIERLNYANLYSNSQETFVKRTIWTIFPNAIPQLGNGT